MLPIYSELVRPSYKRIRLVVTRALFIDFMFYSLITTAGYFSTFNYTKPVVIIRAPLPGMNSDYFMLVAAGCLCFV